VTVDERIEQEASRWLAARDARKPSAEDETAFNYWLDADIRNRVAFLRLEAAWQRADKLRAARPLERAVDPDLLRAQRPRLPLALAASVVLALLVAGGWFAHEKFGWRQFETRVGEFSRIVLDDGSVIDLNTDSRVRVRLDADKRRIRLLRGEGRFQVAHDRTRPFVVKAADTDVRAVGTAFSVRLRESAQIDVLVSEGTVAIATARVPHAPPLNAGDAAVLLPDRLSVSRVEPLSLERRFAWTTGKLQFRGDSLGEAVEEFNRYNRRHLRLADPSLAQLRVGGTFNATDPESFAAALVSAFGLRIDSADPGSIVLRPP